MSDAATDLPFELCSLQIPFYAIVLWSKDPKWKKRTLYTNEKTRF